MNGTFLKEGGMRNFLRGFMSAFDLSGRSFIDIPDFSNGFERDRKALQGDWQMVGNDMRRAMSIVTDER
jgi:hypothetical protein